MRVAPVLRIDRSMADRNPPEDDLSNLRRRVAKARGEASSTSRPPDSAASLAMRFGGEFGAAIIVGALLGYGVGLLSPQRHPWGLLIGLGLGFVAGVVNVVRVAQRLQHRQSVRIPTRRRSRTTTIEDVSFVERPDPPVPHQCRWRSPLQIAGWDADVHECEPVHGRSASPSRAGFMAWAMRRAGAGAGPRAIGGREDLRLRPFGMVTDAAGEEGVKRFFPFVFTLFMFMFAANMLGMFPYWFAPTSQIIITATMALMVFVTVLHRRLRQERLQVPQAVRALGRALVHSVVRGDHRDHLVLLASALATPFVCGPTCLPDTCAESVRRLRADDGRGRRRLDRSARPLPLVMTVALYALEFLVAFLQAYVFAMLTCIYLNDALHPGH